MYMCSLLLFFMCWVIDGVVMVVVVLVSSRVIS